MLRHAGENISTKSVVFGSLECVAQRTTGSIPRDERDPEGVGDFATAVLPGNAAAKRDGWSAFTSD